MIILSEKRSPFGLWTGNVILFGCRFNVRTM
jgi:hypothetical protein